MSSPKFCLRQKLWSISVGLLFAGTAFSLPFKELKEYLLCLVCKFEWLLYSSRQQCPKNPKWRQRKKMARMQFADNEGPDQPAHLRRLIRAFVSRRLDQTARMRTLIWAFAVGIWHKALTSVLRIKSNNVSEIFANYLQICSCTGDSWIQSEFCRINKINQIKQNYHSSLYIK